MRFFLDTADVEKIRMAHELGVLDGVTTNPTLIMKAGKDHPQVIREICKIVKGPVSVEGVGETAPQMVKDAIEFATWAPNVVAKLPMTIEGMKALRTLKQKGIRTNITLVFSASQALIAAKLGADFVSPFVGRLDDVSEDGMQLIRDMALIYRNYGFRTEILAASIRSPMHVMEAARAGAHVATMPYDIFEKLFRHPLTDRGVQLFLEDYRKGVAAKK